MAIVFYKGIFFQHISKGQAYSCNKWFGMRRVLVFITRDMEDKSREALMQLCRMLMNLHLQYYFIDAVFKVRWVGSRLIRLIPGVKRSWACWLKLVGVQKNCYHIRPRFLMLRCFSYGLSSSRENSFRRMVVPLTER